MRRSTFFALGTVMVLVAAAIRLNNAFVYPFLRGYDGFAHFGYIWFLAEAGRIPLPSAGWEFFQPPGYYASMAALWNLLSGTDAVLRLRIGTAIIAILGLTQAFVAYAIVRRAFPEKRLVQLLAAGLMLFLPVHLYSAGFIGNENLTAVLSSLSLLALWWTLGGESFYRAAVLGLILGVTMLAKFTGFVVVATAFATIGLKALLQRRIVTGAMLLSVTAAVMLVICGWFYGRNFVLYGHPFQMSRDQLFLSQIESSQIQGKRHLLEYVLFDPVILYRPQWPRGLSLSDPIPWDYSYSALRESIPTGLYANTWFDGYGGFVLPRVTTSEASRRAGQALLTLGMIPTILMLVGIWAGITKLRRSGWDDTIVMMLIATVAMAVVVIQYTLSVTTQSAVKSTYLMPVAVAAAFWFALGFERATATRPRLIAPLTAACALLAVVSSVVFSHQVFIKDPVSSTDLGGAAFQNLYGVIHFAGGDREAARELFEAASRKNLPLAIENLAYLAEEEGHEQEALYRIRWAGYLQKDRLGLATVAEQQRYIEATLADYANIRAILLFRLGETAAALDAVEESLFYAPATVENVYDLGILKLASATRLRLGPARYALLEQARHAFERALGMDPAFGEAIVMSGVERILAGDCATGEPMLRNALLHRPPGYRVYPVETGPGDQNAAGIRRRRHIEILPPSIDPMTTLNLCAAAGGV
ncbi:MAG TPA: hypothetical protein VN634_12350 [Candidatus Limnocylindrales bacterium]|nr:hypothetical protein [Candidatus Limnocylindrales bacterium]